MPVRLQHSCLQVHPPGRCVLVTGAGRRLGREMALALAHAGWDVAVHYHRSEREALATVAECQALGRRSVALAADLANEDAACMLVPAVVQHLGALDAVINSASLFEHDDASTFSYAMMERHWRSNTAAPIALARALHAHVAQRRAVVASVTDGECASDIEGVVINLLDQKLWNQNPDFLSYTLSKAALEAAGTMLALALAPLVRVVGVAPGLTLTSHMLSEERFAQLHALSPLGRGSTAADVVAAVRFALDNRSLTGTTLLVDGGQHLQRFDRDFSMM